MPDVGINLSMTENVSSQSQKVSSALRSISDSGEDMKEALQLGDLESKYKAFADKVTNIADTKRAFQTSEKGISEKAAGVISQTGGVATKVTAGIAGGDAVGATGGILGATGGMLQRSGTSLGILGGATLGVAGAGMFALNTLEQQYEKHIRALADLTGGIKETKINLIGLSRDLSQTSSKWGYTMEQGLAVANILTKTGGIETTAGIREGGARAFEFARAYGIAPELTGRAAALGARFDRPGALGYSAGGLEASGMSRGMFQEFLTSTLSVFEEGLSRGVVLGFDDIADNLAWLGQYGKEFQGQYGLQKYQQLTGVARGAVELGREEDVLLYKAAQRTLQQQGKKAGYIETAKYMEKGMTAEMFQNLLSVLQEIHGDNREAKIITLKQTFGTSMTTAEKLLEGKPGVAAKLISEPGAGEKMTDLGVLSAAEELSQQVREIGSTLVGAKITLTEKAVSILKATALGAKSTAEGVGYLEKIGSIGAESPPLFGITNTISEYVKGLFTSDAAPPGSTAKAAPEGEQNIRELNTNIRELNTNINRLNATSNKKTRTVIKTK